MYIWIRFSYYSLLEYYIHKINSIHNYHFSCEYVINVLYNINQLQFSPFLVLIGSRNMHLSWTTWWLKMPFRPSTHWPTNWKSLICNTDTHKQQKKRKTSTCEFSNYSQQKKKKRKEKKWAQAPIIILCFSSYVVFAVTTEHKQYFLLQKLT